MPKYVIHIGPPKAGSKYLQSTFVGLHKRLAKLGILYPGEPLLPGARPGAHAALDAPLRAGPSPELEKIFAGFNSGGHKTVVLSWEGAFSLPEASLQYLRGLIGPTNEVEVVYFCRRFAERIPSLWKQDVKRGLTMTLPERIARVMRNPIHSADPNASLCWDRWAGAFGREHLHIVSLNNLRDHKVDLFDHFATTFLGWTGTERPKRVAAHESPGTIDTEVMRVLNAFHHAKTGETSARLSVVYLQKKPELEFGPALEAMERDIGKITLDDRAGAFLPVYQAMMAYKDRLVSPEYGTELFARATTDVEYVRQDYLVQPGVVPALQGVYRALRPLLAAPKAGAEAA